LKTSWDIGACGVEYFKYICKFGVSYGLIYSLSDAILQNQAWPFDLLHVLSEER